MHGLSWIAFSFQHVQEITFNYRITATKKACSRNYPVLQKPVTGTNHGPVQPPEDGQQIYEPMYIGTCD